VNGRILRLILTRSLPAPALAAWTRRGWPVVFCGNQPTAADFAIRFVTQPLAEAERLLKACAQAQPAPNGTSGALDETLEPLTA